MRNYIAEAVGTFFLALAVLVAVSGAAPVNPAALAAVTLGLFVYTIGHISGSHLNPAITIALFMINKITAKNMLAYIACQFAGSFVALLAARTMISIPTPAVGSDLTVGMAELIGAFILAFVVAAVATGAIPAHTSGLAVGASLFVGISVAAAGSSGILNPAVALALSSLNMAYALGPLTGAVIGMLLFKYLHKQARAR